MSRIYIILFCCIVSSCSAVKNNSSPVGETATKKLLPTVISFNPNDSASDIKSVFDKCFKNHGIEIITLDEARSHVRSAIADIYRAASQKPDISPSELQRMTTEDMKYIYNLVTFKMQISASSKIDGISWSVNSWPVNKHSKKPTVHIMPNEIFQQNNLENAVSATVDSVLNSRLLN